MRSLPRASLYTLQKGTPHEPSHPSSFILLLSLCVSVVQSALRQVTTFADLANDTELILKGDSVHEFPAVKSLPYSNVVIRWDGTGERPRLNWTSAQGGDFFYCPASSAKITIEGLTFDTPARGADVIANADNVATAIAWCGQSLTVRDCEFLNVGYAVNANGGGGTLRVEGCRAPLPAGLRGYFVWAGNPDLPIERVEVIDCTAANSTREHILRFSNLKYAMVTGNRLANVDRTAVDRDDRAKHCVVIQNNVAGGEITNNVVTGGGIVIGPLAQPLVGTTITPKDQAIRTSNITVSHNTCLGIGIQILHGSQHVLVQHNEIHNEGKFAFVLDGFFAEWNRSAEDVIFSGNVAYDAGPANWGDFLHVNRTASATLELSGNLYVAPKFIGQPTGAILASETQAAALHAGASTAPATQPPLPAPPPLPPLPPIAWNPKFEIYIMPASGAFEDSLRALGIHRMDSGPNRLAADGTLPISDFADGAEGMLRRAHAAEARKEPICHILFEQTPFRLRDCQAGPLPQVTLDRNLLNACAGLDEIAFRCPKLRQGIYPACPYIEFGRIVGWEGTAGIPAWKADERRAALLWRHVNFSVIQCYAFFNDPAEWELVARTQAKYAHGSMRKKTYLLLSVNFVPGGDPAWTGKPIPREFWHHMFAVANDCADGVVIFAPMNAPAPDMWWLTSLRDMAAQIRSSP